MTLIFDSLFLTVYLMEIYKSFAILCGFLKMLPLGWSVSSRYFQSFPSVYQTICT